MQNNLQFTQPYFEGSGEPNGIPAYNADDGIFTLGGFQNVADTGGQAQFGCIMSSNPTDPNGDGSFYVGIPSGYVIRGVVKYDAGIAMNDPAKPNYFLQGAPITLAYKGELWFYSWDLTLPGSGPPILGSVIAINNATGVIAFLPNGTKAANVPTTWTVLPNSPAAIYPTYPVFAKVMSYDTLLGAALVAFDL
jgi:hypothetical protein